MNEPNQIDARLEQLLGHVLRELPPRRAPATLEARVFAEITRRATLPWWRRSFAHWPSGARIAFVAVCIVLSALTSMRGAWLIAALGPARELHRLTAPVSAAAETAASLMHAIPLVWLYEGLALAAVLYGLLFALGAAAYRTLFLDA
jgi:hypothetical protein